jgi:DNA-binding NarL/FixJ family response regulator
VKKKVTVSIVDDHRLFRNGIAELIAHFDEYKVISQSGNGKEFIESVQLGVVPEMVILDIQMPEMDGEETAKWIKQNQPHVKILALTMHDDERNILRMIKAGARGYVLKNAEPDELKLALDQIWARGFYHSDLVSDTLRRNFVGVDSEVSVSQLTLHEKEREFLQLICTELTYKEIAELLNISTRTVDGYREILFEKFQAKSRVGLVIFAVKNDLVKL